MKQSSNLLASFEEKRRLPPGKDKITGERNAAKLRDFSLVEIIEDKNEQALFRLYLEKQDKEKSEELFTAMLDKKKEISPELEQWRAGALKGFNKVRTDVESVKRHITADFINEVSEHSKYLKQVLSVIPAERAAKYFQTRRLFELAIAEPPLDYNQLQDNLRKIPERMNSQRAKDLEKKIKMLCTELGIDEKQLRDITRRDKGFFEVRRDLRKAVAEKVKGKVKGLRQVIVEDMNSPEDLLKLPGEALKQIKVWFKGFWAREGLIDTVAREIHLAERCDTELHKIGNILAGTIDPDVKKQIYEISLGEDPGKKEFTWPPDVLLTTVDIARALKSYSRQGIQTEARKKIGEYKSQLESTTGRNRRGKLTDDEKNHPDYQALRDKLIKEQLEVIGKLTEKTNTMNIILKKRFDALKDADKPTEVNIRRWFDAL